MLLRVAACSYEGSLFGWDISQSSKSSIKEVADAETSEEIEDFGVALRFAFSTNTNTNITGSCLKAIAVSGGGKYLVCGGQDERIKVYNLVDMKIMGDIGSFAHSGAITCLEFFGDSFLITGSEDFSMCIWRTKDWQCVHILGGHKAGINGLSIHPSGKMALSVCKGASIRLWNLVQGRCSFARKLYKPAESVQWHPSGQYYILTAYKEWQLFSASDNQVVAAVQPASRINKVVFTSPSPSPDDTSAFRVAMITEDKHLRLFNFTGEQMASVDLLSLVGAAGRPRDMYNYHLPGQYGVLAVITSLGKMMMLSVPELLSKSKEDSALGNALLCSHQIKGEPRLIAVAVWNTTTEIQTVVESEGGEDIMGMKAGGGNTGPSKVEPAGKADEKKKDANLLLLPVVAAAAAAAAVVHKKGKGKKKKGGNSVSHSSDSVSPPPTTTSDGRDDSRHTKKVKFG